LFRFDRIHPAIAQITSQREIITHRIVAPQGEFQPSLARLVPVASPGVAAGLGNHSHHVVSERDRNGLSREHGIRQEDTDDRKNGIGRAFIASSSSKARFSEIE
jgi:hypothetical protein